MQPQFFFLIKKIVLKTIIHPYNAPFNNLKHPLNSTLYHVLSWIVDNDTFHVFPNIYIENIYIENIYIENIYIENIYIENIYIENIYIENIYITGDAEVIGQILISLFEHNN